jgi:hypothetical protein
MPRDQASSRGLGGGFRFSSFLDLERHIFTPFCTFLGQWLHCYDPLGHFSILQRPRYGNFPTRSLLSMTGKRKSRGRGLRATTGWYAYPQILLTSLTYPTLVSSASDAM